MNQWQTGLQDLETNTPMSEEHWLYYDVMKLQKNLICSIRVSHHKGICNGIGAIFFLPKK